LVERGGKVVLIGDEVGESGGATDGFFEAPPEAGVDGERLRHSVGEQEGGSDGIGRGEAGGGGEVASVEAGEAVVAVGG
jgi:hypothetical protein